MKLVKVVENNTNTALVLENHCEVTSLTLEGSQMFLSPKWFCLDEEDFEDLLQLLYLSLPIKAVESSLGRENSFAKSKNTTSKSWR